MLKRVLIIEPVHSANATEEDGPFSDTFVGGRGKVWDFISPLVHDTDAWPYVKSSSNNRNYWKDMISFYDHFLVPNNVDHLQKQAEIKLQNPTYAG